MVKKKVGTITLAVGLIAVGVLLFAQNFAGFAVKELYKYWPVLLIGVGVEMIAYMVFYNREENNIRLSVDGACVTFIIILALIANGMTFINMKLPFNFDKGSILNGIHYKDKVRHDYIKENIAVGYTVKNVKVDNSFGDIEIIGTNDKAIKIEAQISVKCNDKEKALAYAKDAVSIKEGETVEIASKEPDSGERDDYSKANIDFIIYVPREISADVTTGFAGISVKDIQGSAKIKNQNGSVEAVGIGGNVDIRNAFGSIEAKDIDGNVDIKNQNGSITAKGIAGEARIENHFASIDASEIAGNITIQNNNGNTEVKNIAGKADVTSSFGNIRVYNIGGDINLTNQNGPIEAKDIKAGARIQNSFGSIELYADSLQNADVLAKTSFGNIECDSAIPVTKNGQNAEARGKLGTGQYKIELHTNNGDIKIR